MRRLLPFTATVAAIVGMAAMSTVTALGAVIHVHPGQSIQAAVDRAHPGDTIVLARGTYRQAVGIFTPNLTLRGAGSGVHGSVLRQPRSGHGPCDDPQEGTVTAICAGGIDLTTGQPSTPLHGITVSRVRVQGFSGDGVVFFNTSRTTVRWSAAVNNGGYGITGFVQHGLLFAHNLAAGDHEAGFYIGDSPHANAVMIGNRAIGNEPFGFLHRDSSYGLDVGNVARDNCVGSFYLDANFGGPPTPARHWVAVRNRYIANDRACPAGEEAGPTPISGIGVAIVGADRVHLVANVVRRNRPTLAGALAGGIVVMSGAAWGTSTADHNLIARNVAHRNAPADIVWDSTGTGNRFVANHCTRSRPHWLC